MKNGKMFEYFSRGKGIALIEGRRRCAGRVLLEIPVMGALRLAPKTGQLDLV